VSRLHRWILVSLIEEITSGEIEAGAQLPREEDLADRFDVSRGVTREAVRALEERGLVTVRHGLGAIVNPRMDWALLDPDVLAALLASPHAGPVLDESIECCTIVESAAAALAAGRACDDDRGRLSEALGALAETAGRDPGDRHAADAYREAELVFHRSLLRASGNAALVQVAEPIQRALGTVRASRPLDSERVKRELEERARIVRAVQHGDREEAREAMRVHLEGLAEEMREYVGSRTD
jgi:GntR family transcriptional repressor for pyruvate dehydrogenase complex